MKQMQMLQDLKGLAIEDAKPHENCTEVSILTNNHDLQQFLAQNIAMRDYEEFIHFLGHLIIKCYELGYQRKCKELEEAELDKIFQSKGQ